MNNLINGVWTLVAPDGKRFHAKPPLECCRSEQEDRKSREAEKCQLDLFAGLKAGEGQPHVGVWREPNGEVPEGNILIEVDLKSGDSDVALVFIGDDGDTLYCADDSEDVYGAWVWGDVSRYAMLEDVLPAR